MKNIVNFILFLFSSVQINNYYTIAIINMFINYKHILNLSRIYFKL